MSPGRKGLLYGVIAYLCWGLFPLYWKLLRPSGPLELLAHRIVWSCVFVVIVVTVVRSWGNILVLVRQPRTMALTTLAAVVIAVNWMTYIYGVNSDRVVETSLGYFINPLVTVVLGVVVLRERLRTWQWAAVGVGVLAVLVLTVDYGHVPYLALTLAASFGTYGLIKKRLGVPAAEGLLLESGALAIPAIVVLIVLASRGAGTVGHVSWWHTVLIVASGAVTAVPLMLFAGAANRIPLSAIGLLQYLAPVLQLACGVLVFSEPMPPARLAGFALVWLALAVFTWDGVHHARSRRRTTIVDVAEPARI